jgi:hypothetical protein
MANPSDGPIGFTGVVPGPQPAGMRRDPAPEPDINVPGSIRFKPGLKNHCQNLLSEITQAIKEYRAAIDGYYEAEQKVQNARSEHNRAATAYQQAVSSDERFGEGVVKVAVEYVDAEKAYDEAVERWVVTPLGQDERERRRTKTAPRPPSTK